MTLSATDEPPSVCRAFTAPFGFLIRDHDDRVTDLEFRMRDAAIRHGQAVEFFRSEHLFIEVHRGFRVSDDETHRNRSVIRRLDLCTHAATASSNHLFPDLTGRERPAFQL